MDFFSFGTYTLNDGTLTAATEVIAADGIATFTQNGGTNAISGNLYLATLANGDGTYNLNAGSLSATNEYVGYNNTGLSGTPFSTRAAAPTM